MSPAKRQTRLCPMRTEGVDIDFCPFQGFEPAGRGTASGSDRISSPHWTGWPTTGRQVSGIEPVSLEQFFRLPLPKELDHVDPHHELLPCHPPTQDSPLRRAPPHPS